MRAAMRRSGRELQSGILEVSIEALSHDGRGIARVNGKTVFVEGALPGENVTVQIYRRRRDYDEGRVSEIKQSAPERVVPHCEHFGICGGCVLQHLAPQAQVAAKQRTLFDNLQRIGHVEADTVLAPMAGPVWGYRRRARLSVRFVAARNKVLVGFVERGKPYVTDTRRCEILDPKVGALIEPLSELFTGMSIADRIPQVELAVGDECTVLVIRILSGLSEEDRQRLENFEASHSVHVFLQRGKPDELESLSGRSVTLTYFLEDWNVELAFQPADFIQVNADINRQMIARAMELLELQPHHTVLDLFCGLGNFTLPLARKVNTATGIEGDAGLIRRARLNAEHNGIGNASFHHADLFTDVSAQPWLQRRYDRVLLAPPRAGAREIIAQFPKLAPERVVYVSCHPATLARDASTLVNEQGYRLLAAGVLDMFPHTAHVESIAVFARS